MATQFPQNANHRTLQSPGEDYDPFADAEKLPALSFRDAPIGTVYKGIVTNLPKVVQSRDYDSGKPLFWDDGNPQNSVVIELEVETPTGPEGRSLWAKMPSAMFRAIGAAQKAAGKRIAVGGTLYVRFAATEPPKSPKHSPQKLYEAKYEPPVETDPWGAPSDGRPLNAAQPPPPAVTPQPATPPVGWGHPAPGQAPQQPALPGTPPRVQW